jgi:hypothetical protein
VSFAPAAAFPRERQNRYTRNALQARLLREIDLRSDASLKLFILQK